MSNGSDLNLRVTLDALDKASGPMRAVASSGNAMAASVRAAAKELQGLKAQQRDIASLRMASREQAVANAQWQQASARVRELTQEHAKAATVTKAMAREMQQAKAQAAALKGEFVQQRNTAQAMRDRLAAAGVSTSNLAAHERQLRGEIERTSAAMKAQGERMRAVNELKRAQAAMATKGAAMAVGGAVAAGAGKRMTGEAMAPMEDFKAHEDAMLGIARQVPGARNEMGQLTDVYRKAEDEVRSLSQEIPLATTEIANMMTASARMEVPTDQLREQVKLAAEMAIAFDAVPEHIAESMGKVAKNYKIPVTDIRGLADSINYLDDNAISKGSDIIDFLNRTSGVMSTVGMSSKNAAALGSTLLTLGESRETASTAANAMVQKLAAAEKGTKSFQKAMQELGLSSTDVQKGMQSDALGTMNKVFDKIREMPSDKRIGIMVDLFGMEHSDTAAKLVDKPEELQRQVDLANSDKAGGSMSKEFAARADTVSAKQQMLENRLFNLKAALGQTLVPAMTELMKVVGPILTSMTAWVKENPKLTGGILAVAAGLGAVVAVGGTLVMAVGAIIGPLALLKMGMAMVGLTSAAALLPILATIAAVGLLVGAGVAVYARWADIKGGAILLWQDIRTAFGNGLTYLASIPQRMWQAGSDMIQGLINGVTAKLGALRDTIVGAASSARDWFAGVLGIQSPSRVFMQLGGWVSEGAAMGIQSHAPLVAKAAAVMAAMPVAVATPAMAAPALAGAPGFAPPAISAPAPAAPASAQGQAAAGDTFHISVTASPGMDEQALAKLIAQEVGRIKSREASRGLSGMQDR